MKKNLIARLIATAMMTTTVSTIIPITEVHAGVQKTANRNQVNLNVDGKTTNVVAYNIDGYNYFRAADICKSLNYKLMQFKTLVPLTANTYIDGIKIIPEKVFEGTVEEAPTTASVAVTMDTKKIYFSDFPRDTDAFNLGDRNWFKLADIVDGSIYSNSVRETLPVLSTSYDDSTKTIIIKKSSDPITTPNTPVPTPSISSGSEQPLDIQPLLIAPPELQSVPGNILKDKSKNAIAGNYTYAYSIYPAVGQCTWYVVGRFYETTGIDITSAKYGNQLTMYGKGSDLGSWLDGAKKCVNVTGIDYKGNEDYSNIPDRGIAVWATHETFIEYVERDASGKPLYVYYTEANTLADGKYVPTRDGVVRKMNIKDMKYQGGGKFYGWIVEK